MNEPIETEQAEHLIKQGVKTILAVTMIGTAILIYFGQGAELWATFDTINSEPSLTIYPSDPNLPLP